MIGACTMRIRSGLLLLALGSIACGDDLPDPPPAGESSSSSGTTSDTTMLPLETSSSSGPSTSTGDEPSSSSGFSSVGIPDECTVSADCPRGELCVAPFDQAAGPEGKGPLACVVECVVIMDEDRWCADAAACCDPEAECTDRGYCVYPGESSDGSDSGSGTGSAGTSSGG